MCWRNFRPSSKNSEECRPSPEDGRRKHPPWVTLFFAAAAITLSGLCGVFQPSQPPLEKLLASGASVISLLNEKEGWRLALSLFLHNDVYHLLGNVVYLFLIGFFFEGGAGWKKTLLILLCSGTVSMAAESKWSAVLCVGMSGAVMALGAAFLIDCGMGALQSRRAKILLLPALLLLSTAFPHLDSNPPESSIAHLAGILCGVFLALALRPPEMRRFACAAAAAGVLLLLAFPAAIIHPDRALLAESYVFTGRLEASSGNYEKAERYYRRADSLDPQSEGLFMLGRLYISAGRIGEGIGVFEERLQQFPQDRKTARTLKQILDITENTN